MRVMKRKEEGEEGDREREERQRRVGGDRGRELDKIVLHTLYGELNTVAICSGLSLLYENE